MTDRRLHLGLSLTHSWALANSWRRDDARDDEIFDLALYRDLTLAAEAAKFDFVFQADSPLVNTSFVGHRPTSQLDSAVLLPALAALTDRIGLITTQSTTLNEPYDVARRLASLDRISNGRAGWNAVTSQGGAGNFGLDSLPPQPERYDRADEFVEVLKKLWESWPSSAFVRDRATGVYAVADRIRPIDHSGRFFRVEGPLNIPSSPQVHPVTVQAGSSERGRRFAARHADAVFAIAPTFDESCAFADDIRRRAVEAGRGADAILVLPGVNTYIADTESEARALYADLIHDADIALGLVQLSQILGAEVHGFDLDRPLPPEAFPPIEFNNHQKTRAQLYQRLSEEHGVTLRRLIVDYIFHTGHWTLIGTPEQVADALADRFARGAADGYIFQPHPYPIGTDRLFDDVVPLLQERGLFREEYESETLRGHLGLQLPTL